MKLRGAPVRQPTSTNKIPARIVAGATVWKNIPGFRTARNCVARVSEVGISANQFGKLTNVSIVAPPSSIQKAQKWISKISPWIFRITPAKSSKNVVVGQPKNGRFGLPGITRRQETTLRSIVRSAPWRKIAANSRRRIAAQATQHECFKHQVIWRAVSGR